MQKRPLHLVVTGLGLLDEVWDDALVVDLPHRRRLIRFGDAGYLFVSRLHVGAPSAGLHAPRRRVSAMAGSPESGGGFGNGVADDRPAQADVAVPPRWERGACARGGRRGSIV